MLEQPYAWWIIISLLGFSFPPGYLIIGHVARRINQPISPLVKVPLSISVGFIMQMFFSILIGPFSINAIVIPSISLIALVLVIMWRIKTRADTPMFSKNHFKGSIITIAEYVAAAVTLILPMYYLVSIISKFRFWPPVGDGITHGLYTSLILFRNHVPIDNSPLLPTYVSYPIGFHAFAANIASTFNILPGEAVFLTATISLGIISIVVFALTFHFSRSIILALLPSLFIFHSSSDLESWIGGFLFNGPFPNLIGYQIIFTLSLVLASLLHLKTLKYLSFVFVAFLFTTFFVYPAFTPYIILLITIFLIVHFDKNILASIRNIAGCGHNKLSQLVSIRNSIVHSRRSMIALSLLFYGLIIISMSIGGLSTIYHNVFISNFNLSYLSSFSSAATPLDLAPKFSNVSQPSGFTINTNVAFYLVPITSIIAVYAIMLRFKKQNVNDILSLALFMIIVTFLISTPIAGFLLPARSILFMIIIFWIMVCYGISRLDKTINLRLGLKILNVLSIGGIFSFILMSNIVSYHLPLINNLNGATPGWFISGASFYPSEIEGYLWLKNNVKHNELILNDMTYSTIYAQSASIQNLTFSFWADPHIAKDLKSIWTANLDKEQAGELIRKYDVKYIFITPDTAMLHSTIWGGQGDYIYKSQGSDYYKNYFLSVGFTSVVYEKNGTIILKVLDQ